MDAIQSVIVTTPTLPAPAAQAPAIALPSVQPAQTSAVPDQIDFSAQAMEQKRVATIQRSAQDIANIYVVSDQRFTIFKDVSGQYITRFTSLRTGKVTYIPEPDLMRLSGGDSTAPTIKISA